MGRNAWKDIANLQIEVLSTCTKSHVLPSISFRKEKTGNGGKLSNILLANGLRMPIFGTNWLVDLIDVLWSLNKLAAEQSQHGQERACDKRLARLTSYTHHMSDHRQYCHLGRTAQQCRLVLSQDSDFAGDFEDSKSTSRRFFLYLRKPGKIRSKKWNV